MAPERVKLSEKDADEVVLKAGSQGGFRNGFSRKDLISQIVRISDGYGTADLIFTNLTFLTGINASDFSRGLRDKALGAFSPESLVDSVIPRLLASKQLEKLDTKGKPRYKVKDPHLYVVAKVGARVGSVRGKARTDLETTPNLAHPDQPTDGIPEENKEKGRQSELQPIYRWMWRILLIR
jgi:hypothetical protein